MARPSRHQLPEEPPPPDDPPPPEKPPPELPEDQPPPEDLPDDQLLPELPDDQPLPDDLCNSLLKSMPSQRYRPGPILRPKIGGRIAMANPPKNRMTQTVMNRVAI